MRRTAQAIERAQALDSVQRSTQGLEAQIAQQMEALQKAAVDQAEANRQAQEARKQAKEMEQRMKLQAAQAPQVKEVIVEREVVRADPASDQTARLRGEMQKTVSEELRAPLTALLDLPRLLVDGLQKPLGDTERGQLEILQERGQEILELIEGLTAMSALQAGGLKLAKVSTDVPAARPAGGPRAPVRASRPRATGSRPTSSRALRPVVTDSRRVEQVLGNLILSAVKYTEVGEIRVTCYQRDREVVVTVADDGIGFTPEEQAPDLPAVLPGGSAGRAELPGTGLLLTVAERLPLRSVARSRWRARWTGARGSPSRCRSRDSEAMSDATPNAVRGMGGRSGRCLTTVSQSTRSPATLGRVLIVDDDLRSGRRCGTTSSTWGTRCATSSCAEEALVEITREAPDLVLLDVRMPGINGIDLCRQLKGDPMTHLIPVVLLTAERELDSRVAGLEAGADDYFTKPVHPRELDARLRSLIRLKRVLEELEEAESLITSLALTIEARDPYTAGHCVRLAAWAMAFGERLGLSEEEQKALRLGGFLHDLGKIAVPDGVLLKAGPAQRRGASAHGGAPGGRRPARRADADARPRTPDHPAPPRALGRARDTRTGSAEKRCRSSRASWRSSTSTTRSARSAPTSLRSTRRTR